MTTLTPQEKKVVESFRQLQPERRRFVLLEMARSDSEGWKRFQSEGESQMRQFARQKGLDWDQMSDSQRQDFVEKFVDGQDS